MFKQLTRLTRQDDYIIGVKLYNSDTEYLYTSLDPIRVGCKIIVECRGKETIAQVNSCTPRTEKELPKENMELQRVKYVCYSLEEHMSVEDLLESYCK